MVSKTYFFDNENELINFSSNIFYIVVLNNLLVYLCLSDSLLATSKD